MGFTPAAGIPRSPRLHRSRSGASALTPPPTAASRPVQRSKSTTKSRTHNHKYEESIPNRTPSAQKRREPSGKFAARSPGPTSPSAWALSPGRYVPSSSVIPPPQKSPCSAKKVPELGGRGGGAMSGVLKYFRQKKKAPPAQEEEYHHFRVMQNRLLQWRFVNARAEATMAIVKKVAQKKLWNGWVKVSIMRNSNMEKKMQSQRLKHEMKLIHILISQIPLLKEWPKLEGKNCEGVGRMLRKLSALSVKLPLIDDSKADVLLVYDAIRTATSVMDNLGEPISNFDSQVEKTCYLVTELTIIAKQERECLKQLERWIPIVASLQEEEKRLRIQPIQLAEDYRRLEELEGRKLDFVQAKQVINKIPQF